MFIEKKKKGKSIIFLIIFILIGATAVYFYNSSMFEQVKPMISIENKIYWNLKNSVKVRIFDNVGVKNYKAILSDGENSVVLVNKTLDIPLKDLEVEIEPPRLGMFFEKNNISLIIEATDSSKWNFLAGNSSTKSSEVIIDNKKPTLFTITNSYGIRKGGSAVVIFKAEDENLDELYINTNFDKKFKAQKFYKDGYYISLVAWPVSNDTFSATIVVKDKAGNKNKSNLGFYLKNKTYRTSKITLKDDFLEGKISELFGEANLMDEAKSPVEKFKYVNEDLRKINEDLIESITSNVFLDEKISSFDLNSFYPLKNAAAVASYGDHRYFYYDNKLVSESYHLGLDLASVGFADIKSNNLSRVAYADFNGIYGKMPILYHGLGLYSLYGHCSEINFNVNDIVEPDMIIAKTGKSGLALGDHLHFGILVQGVEVRPEEWMDKKWVKVNITDIIENAKKLIDKK